MIHILKRCFARLILAMLGSVFVASSSGFAAIDITKSPFTNPELSGPVDEINLVGTDK